MASPIGLLLDTVNNNTGDKAIRLVMERFLKSHQLDYDLLDPFSPSKHLYETVIVGGGELLQDKGDYFYDDFRIKGPHILNTMSVNTTQDMKYLTDYLYVSVRSKADRQRLGDVVKDVKVVPCVTMLMEGKETAIHLDRNSIGFHFHWVSFSACPDSFKYINQFKHYQKLFIPFTHYNYDGWIMKAMRSKVMASTTVGYQDPEALFGIIGKLGFLVCSSLHAAIFAYVNNVPFIVYPYCQKIEAFMQERGLAKWLFHNSGEMFHKLEALIDERPDYSGLIIKDQERVREHFYDLNSILKTVRSTPAREILSPTGSARFLPRLQSLYRRSIFRALAACRHWWYNAQSILLPVGTKRRSATHLLFISKEKIKSIKQLYSLCFLSLDVIRKYGIRYFLYKVKEVLERKFRINVQEIMEEWFRINYSYKQWILKNEPNQLELEVYRQECVNFHYRPKITIITPVYNTNERILKLTINSVMNQVYDNWELCLVDGASAKPEVKNILQEFAKRDSRIKVKFLGENQGISGNSNQALALATGDFIALLDHDDELAPFAFYEVIKLLNENRELDFIYSDKDNINPKGERLLPFFKPDWSPDMFLSCNYLCHFTVIRKELVDQVGGFRTEYDGSQDYDLFLRIIQETNRIAHIPKILYHWRMVAASAASSIAAKPYAYVAAKKAISDHLQRNNIEAEVLDGMSFGYYRVRYKIADSPKISILIPNKDGVRLLSKCVESIINKTDYISYEIIILNNQSSDKITLSYYERIKSTLNIKVRYFNSHLNLAAIKNLAAFQAEAEYILFMDNDIEVISNEWLSAMLEHAQRKTVGAVGALLYYPNNTVQHAGIILGVNEIAGHSHRCFSRASAGYFGRIRTTQNLSAVSGACMMARKAIFEEVGGFDEDLLLGLSDVEFCLRLRERGYLVVYTPFAQLYHHESLTRGYEDSLEKQERFKSEIEYFKKRWGHLLKKGDPYYNTNLTLEKEDFSIRI